MYAYTHIHMYIHTHTSSWENDIKHRLQKSKKIGFFVINPTECSQKMTHYSDPLTGYLTKEMYFL